MKNTIEDPLKLTVYPDGYSHESPSLDAGEYELVDLSIAQSLQTEVEEQKRLLKEMADLLTTAKQKAFYQQYVKGGNVDDLVSEAITKYNEYINKQPK